MKIIKTITGGYYIQGEGAGTLLTWDIQWNPLVTGYSLSDLLSFSAEEVSFTYNENNRSISSETIIEFETLGDLFEKYVEYFV